MKERNEKEIPEDIQEFLRKVKKEDRVSEIVGAKDEKEKLPIELTREQFFLEVKGAYDHHANTVKASQDQMQIAANLIATANMFEQDPEFRVGYIKYPNGLLGLAVEPKGSMGFKTDERKRE